MSAAKGVKLEVGGFWLDLPSDFGILISKSIADIREPENRNSDWSKTFTIPASKINRKAFTHLFELDADIRNTTATNFTPDFNPNLKAPATLYVDELVQIKGFLRLNKINTTDDDRIECDCTLHGQLADLFTTISEGKLFDLNLSQYNHILTQTNVFDSWDTQVQKLGSGYVNFDISGNPTGEGYIYGLIDTGLVPSLNKLAVHDFAPMLYAKTIVDEIFLEAGYSYTSDSFFNSTIFKRLVIPCPKGAPELNDSQITEREFYADRGSNVTYNVGDVAKFDNEISDPSNQYNPTTGEFTCVYGMDCQFLGNFSVTATGLPVSTILSLGLDSYINGVANGETLYVEDITDGSGNFSASSFVACVPFVVNNGDVVTWKVSKAYDYNAGGSYTPTNVTINAGSTFYNEPMRRSFYIGQSVDMSGFFNDDTKQSDFMKWLFIMFNLYAEPDIDYPSKIFIAPREDFYTTDIIDWSNKLDKGQQLSITPMGELNANPYYFTYKSGDDQLNKLYQASTSRIYGDKYLFINNDFVKSEKKIEIGFAPSQINQRDGKTLTLVDTGKTSSQIRILYYSGLGSGVSTVYDENTLGVYTGAATVKTSYPITLHIDSITASTLDLCFGTPFAIGLPAGTAYTTNNLFNAYWSKYLQEITDKNSKIVKGWFQITPSDINTLSFRNLYYFENNYFRLNKITDYNPLSSGVFECEFLKLKTGAAFVAGSGGVGDVGFPYSDCDNRPKDSINGFSSGQTSGGSVRVGDNIRDNGRSNFVAGSNGVRISGGVERTTVINSNNIEVDTSDQLFIQGEKFEIQTPADQDIITYDLASAAWIPQAAAGGGSYSYTRLSKINADSPYTIANLSGDIYIEFDCSGGNSTVNLPTLASSTARYTIKKVNSTTETLTIDGNGSETIDGSTTAVIYVNNLSITIIKGTGGWIIV